MIERPSSVRLQVLAMALVPVLSVVACAPPSSGPVAVRLRIDPAMTLGSVNPMVAGSNGLWGDGRLLADLNPPLLRIDASLEVASTGPDALDVGPLMATVAAARALGAEPLVILSYMPTWLAGPGTGRPASRAPSDLVAWRELIREVVDTLATALAPARWFEVWNEPDMG